MAALNWDDGLTSSMNNLVERLKALDRATTDGHAKMTSLESRMETLEANLDEVRAQLAGCREATVDLHRVVESQKEQISALQATQANPTAWEQGLTVLGQRVERLDGAVVSVDEAVQGIAAKHEELANEVSESSVSIIRRKDGKNLITLNVVRDEESRSGAVPADIISNSAIAEAEIIQQREMSVGTQATVTPDEVPEVPLPTRHPRVVVQLPPEPPVAEQSPSRKAPPAASTRNSNLKRKASAAKDNSRPSSSVSKRSKALRETEIAPPPPSSPPAEVSPTESDTICVSHPSRATAPSTPTPHQLQDEEDSSSVAQEQSTDLLTQFGARPHRSGGAQAGELNSASKATSVAEENDIAFEAKGKAQSRRSAGSASTRRAR